MTTRVKNRAEIAAMREGGKMLAEVLDRLKRITVEGMTTMDLANEAGDYLKKLGGKPAFLHYQGFPECICTSINNEVVHGIPSVKRLLKGGDIVSLDFGVLYQGLVTDGAISYILGKPLKQAHADLVERTEKSLQVGVNSVKNNIRTGDIGHAIESYLKRYNYGVIKDLVGHGVGHHLHEDPNIPNYGRPNTGPWLNKNMTIAIEPMVTLASESIRVSDDKWTILTEDNSLAAHFEHTVLITEDGAEILTALSA